MPPPSIVSSGVNPLGWSFARLAAASERNDLLAMGAVDAARRTGASSSWTGVWSMDPHAPHAVHRPVHFGNWASHLWQTYTGCFGMLESCHALGKKARDAAVIVDLGESLHRFAEEVPSV
jgi:hypothetical protein